MNPKPIAVYGATGHTGKFVLRELGRRGYPTVAIGRNKAPLPIDALRAEHGEWRQAACDDPDALDEALRGTCALINCAGPFLDTAPALVEAALRAGIHYLDITAEQRSVRQTLATYHEEAQQRGTVVLPGMAFYGGLADLLAADATGGSCAVERIDIGVALDYWHPTNGTRKTGQRNAARRLIVSDGRLCPIPQRQAQREWPFPEPFGMQAVLAVPLSEVILIHSHIAACEVCSYMNLAPLRDLEDPRTPPPAIGFSGSSAQRFVMDVHAVTNGRSARICAAGQDIYAVTAPIVVLACIRLLAQPPTTGGAYAPAALFDAKGFLDGLAPYLHITRAYPRAAAEHTI